MKMIFVDAENVGLKELEKSMLRSLIKSLFFLSQIQSSLFVKSRCTCSYLTTRQVKIKRISISLHIFLGYYLL